ncbi:MAG: hypothetical protein QME49_03495 [bacterium]|nr:hypothetical protein [bacterium]
MCKMLSTMQEISKTETNTMSSESFQIAEERKKDLLEKVKRRTITIPETYELSDLLQDDPKIRNLDENMRTLIMIGLGALGGYIIAKLVQPEPSCQR